MVSAKNKPRKRETKATPGNFDVQTLREVLQLLEGSSVAHLAWTCGETRLEIHRGQPNTQPLQPPAAPSTALVPEAPAPLSPPAKGGEAFSAQQGSTAHVVLSPFVGTFYRAPGPEQAPFVELGASVRKGQVLCIVEAMKLMNEIESEVSGTLAEIMVENAQPVEFGQPLFRINP